jgi:glucose-1-phosphate thymidylyltransferase
MKKNTSRCGIILAGGTATRLYPVTKSVSKQLLPVYDKPLIYYPLSTLISAGIKDILIIVSSVDNLKLFKNLLGSAIGDNISLEYIVQDKPRGVADAFIVAEHFISERPVVLALGDNIFYGEMFNKKMKTMVSSLFYNGNTIFGCKVKEPSRYGVARFEDNKLIEIVEKPQSFISEYAIPGLYFYDDSVVRRAKELVPSKRGELEITDLNNSYISDNSLRFFKLPEGTVWFDTGNHDHLLEASNFIKAIQSRTGVKIADIDRLRNIS